MAGVEDLRINHGRLLLEKREGEGNPIFVVRFGFGAHGVRGSNWDVQLSQDLDLFFQPSNSPQRNILFMEDAMGTQSFTKNVKRGYREYGSWLRAYFWADFSKVWTQLGLEGEERFPSVDRLDKLIDTRLRVSSNEAVDPKYPGYADTYRFIKSVLEAIDDVIKKRGVKIELEFETRRDEQERVKVQKAIDFLERHTTGSLDAFKEWIMQMWNLERLRDVKIIDDLMELYKKTYKQKIPTKIYVSLGEYHAPIKDRLGQKLGKRPSYDISMKETADHPEYENSEFTVVVAQTFALLDSGTHISNNEWVDLYEQAKEHK